MKYLLIAHPGARMLPPEHGAALYEASIKWIQAHIDDGSIDCVYTFPDAGGITIANADSHEQVYEALISYPLYGFFRWEVKPLCDWERVQTTAANAYRAAGQGG